MENKEKNKQNSVSFDNLKKLSGLISGSELTSLANYISKSKTALDAFCKKLKEHEIALKKAEETKVKVVEKVVEEPVKQEEPVQNVNFKPVEKKSFERNGNREPRFNNREQTPNNKSQIREGKANRENKPFNKDGKTTPKVAHKAPRNLCCLYPMKVAMFIAIGPGVDSATPRKL